MNKYNLLLIIIIVLISSKGFSQNNDIEINNKIDKKVKYFIELADSLRLLSNTPGVGMAIVYKDEIIYQGGLGLRNISKNQPVTKNSLFAIGSVTKPMTGIVASKLVSNGILNWETPIIKYYPEFKVADEYVTRNVNIKDLFTHMSGVGKYDLIHYHNSSITQNEILGKLPYLESQYSLRQKWSYNNIMYLVAGIVEEKVSNKKWSEIINDEIFAPLKMNNSFATYQDFMNYPENCTAYKSDGSTKIKHLNIDNIGPSGAVSSTPQNMANWLQMLVGEGKVGDKEFLSKHQFNYLTGAHASFNSTGSIHAAIGWITGYYNGQKWLQKDGGIDGFNAKVTVLPNVFGFVVMTNHRSKYYELITDYALNIFVYDNYERDLKREKELIYKEPKVISKNIDNINVANLPHTLEEFIGEYKHKVYGSIIIRLGDKKNSLEFKFNDYKGLMEHMGFDSFKTYLDVGDNNMTQEFSFLTDINGNVDKIEIQLESKMPMLIFDKIE